MGRIDGIREDSNGAKMVEALTRLDGYLGKNTFVLSLLAMGAGAALNRYLAQWVFIVPYVFGTMTLFIAMGCSARQFGSVARRPLPLLFAFLGLHLVGPLVAKLLGTAFFGSTSSITVGLILAMAVPTGMTSVMWAGIAAANLPLSLTIVSLDSLLSPVVVPLTIKIFAGHAVAFDALGLLRGLCIIILIPTLFGVAINDLTKGRVPRKIKPFSGPFVKLGLLFVIAVNVAGAWPQVVQIGEKAGVLLTLLLGLAAFGYFQGYLWGKSSRDTVGTTKSLVFAVGMRNISAGIVIAMAYFPAEVAIPVVASTLFQQPLATLVHRYFQGEEGKKTEPTKVPRSL